VDSEQHDKAFIGTFSIVLGFLGVFTATIWIIAVAVGGHEPTTAETAALIEQRIKPAGQVVTDASQLLAMTAPVAARAPMSADEIVTRICSACHGTGVLNAPKTGDKAAWAKLKATGLAALVGNAIKGKNQMPARGGDPSLSDTEVKAAVELMLKQSGV
jgi:cytochrome c5